MLIHLIMIAFGVIITIGGIIDESETETISGIITAITGVVLLIGRIAGWW